MEIPLNVQVECKDGVFGQSAYVLINPVVGKVSHLVVRENESPHMEYVVPMDAVEETIAGTILLRCSKAEIKKMEPFLVTHYIEDKVPSRYSYSGMYGLGSSYYLPFNTADITVSNPVEVEQLPPGELAVFRGTHVEATDGFIGKVDEFVVNADNGRITHLVMREGHLWGKREVIIPLSAIEKSTEETVYLKLNKQQVEALPSFPLHRHWA